MVERLITGGVDQGSSTIDTTTGPERWCLVRVVLSYPTLRTGSIAAYGKIVRLRSWDEPIASELKIVVCSPVFFFARNLVAQSCTESANGWPFAGSGHLRSVLACDVIASKLMEQRARGRLINAKETSGKQSSDCC